MYLVIFKIGIVPHYPAQLASASLSYKLLMNQTRSFKAIKFIIRTSANSMKPSFNTLYFSSSSKFNHGIECIRQDLQYSTNSYSIPKSSNDNLHTYQTICSRYQKMTSRVLIKIITFILQSLVYFRTYFEFLKQLLVIF